MRDMSRLCIYVTYNKDQKIKEYIGYMLKELKKCCSKLCVVCNYPKLLGGEEYLYPHADVVFFRENKGYDAGAYKDALCTLLGWEAIYEYNELILVNDSFFGPFYDLNQYFDLMEEVKCDFWGMTRHSSGELTSTIHYKFGAHIQSYFLVFRSKVFKSTLYKNFWENMIYPNTFIDTIVNFEIGINDYLEKNAFISMALTDVWGMEFAENENPTIYYSLELIRDKGFPIMKKKSLLINTPGFENALTAVDFLQTSELYPVKWIWEWIDSQFYIEGDAMHRANCLEAFYQRYKKIYIYGAGICGKRLSLYFEKKGWKLEGIVVSDTAGQNTECIEFADVNVDAETGIVVSVFNKEVSKSIEQYISSKCSREQLFLISECAAIAF